MKKNQAEGKKAKKFSIANSSGLIMLVCLILAVVIFKFILGDPSNFVGNNPENHPLQGNFAGLMYKGGFIVPILITCLLTVIALSIERFFAIKTAEGKGNLVVFVQGIKNALAQNDLAAATELCNKQQGTVGNVVANALVKYGEVEKDNSLSKEQKILAIQKEIEEATALEMPMLSQNLNIIAALTSLGTLIGLLGTVIGMIRSFAALAGAGGTDSIALSAGISEALINTASGILTGVLAIISYNVFTSKIDKITYGIDEVGFTIVQSFAASHK